jgi:catalase
MMPGSAERNVLAEIVTTTRMLAGSHPGFRRVHAKGLVCTGRFQASLDARWVTRATHLQGQTLSVIIRVANSAGNPAVHDGLPNVRSLAVKL